MYAAVFAFVCITNLFSNFIALNNTDIVNTIVASNAGCIIFPVIFELIYLKESLSFNKYLAVFILIIVVFQPFFEKNIKIKSNIKGNIACMMICAFSGLQVIILKLYTMTLNVKSNDVFCLWTNILTIPMVFIISIINSKGLTQLINDVKKIRIKTYFIAFGGMILTSLVTLMNINILKNINVSTFSVLKFSFSLVFTSIFARIFLKESLTKKEFLNLVLSSIAVYLNIM